MKATERLFFNADRTRVVKEGDRKAAFLYAAPGDEIPEAACKKFGLADGGLKGSKKAGKDEAGGPGSDEATNAAPNKAPTPKRPRPKARNGGRKRGKGPSSDKAAAPDADKAAKPEADKTGEPESDKGDSEGGLTIRRGD